MYTGAPRGLGLKRFVAFVSPFLFVHVVNLTFLKYFIVRMDADGLMALGQNWLEWNPLHVFHMPGTIGIELSAAFQLITGYHFRAFQTVGVLFNILAILACGIWVAKMDAEPWDIFTLSVLAAFMPTALAGSRIFELYFLPCMLGVPIALALYLRKDYAFAALGFLVANLFTALAILVPAFFIAQDRKKAIQWTALGFLLGANVLTIYWPMSFIDAMLGKGGAGSGLPLSVWIWQVAPLAFLTSCYWNTLIPLAWLKRDRFTLSASILMFIGTAEVGLRPVFTPVGDFGIQPERYFIFLPLIMGYSILHARKYRKVILVVVLVAGLLSVKEYVQDQRLYQMQPHEELGDPSQYRTGMGHPDPADQMISKFKSLLISK